MVPPESGKVATAFLARSQDHELLILDVIIAETVYVLESFYRVHRSEIADMVRSLLAFSAVLVSNQDLLLESVRLYESTALAFGDCYLIATAAALKSQIATLDVELGKVAGRIGVRQVRLEA